MRFLLTILILACLISCHSKNPDFNVPVDKSAVLNDKIKVLNFGTFHMGYTSDANKVDFDENSATNRNAIQDIVNKLAAFEPTVIIVESTPDNNETLNENYNRYLNDGLKTIDNPDEVELLAFALGKMSGVPKIYGIDHKLSYNYNIASEISNAVDSITYADYMKNPFKYSERLKVDFDQLTLLEKLQFTNHPEYLDFLITINADILTHIGTINSFEGADEASKFYKRNLRMFSNMNRLPLKKEDRVFVLLGAAHTAFFKDFIDRSPRYEAVNTLNYLN